MTEERKQPSYEEIKNSANLFLSGFEPCTEEIIRNYVKLAVQALPNPEKIDVEGLIAELIRDRQLLTQFREPVIFEGTNTDHRVWFNVDVEESIEWKFWGRYKRYLEKDGMSPAAIKDIDKVTGRILSQMESPQRDGSWTNRGMVVGYVQSGKTANYIGLMCKAADAGYKLIIVLAGTTKDLRYQTQKRIDFGFIGKRKDESDKTEIVGVGTISREDVACGKSAMVPSVNCLTGSAIDNDFRKANTPTRIEIENSNVPVCLVIKKNRSILANVAEWVHDLSSESEKVSKIPLLLIDDEADNASPNTKKYENAESQGENEITTINKYIREILNTFEKSSYVGYTATPYANVFIDPDAYSDKLGSDIFPRNYIISMERPPGYFGNDTVFGSCTDAITPESLFPGIKLVTDDEELIPSEKRGDSSFIPKNITTSLKEAVRSFILAAAVREVRNEGKNRRLDNSMLIHISRYVAAQGTNREETDLQSGLSKLVRKEVEEIESGLVFKESSELSKLHELWDSSYYSDSGKIREIMDASFPDPACTVVTWEQISGRLLKIVKSIKFRTLNGGNKDDALDYSKYEKGLNVIAIGGDKLSRGLTLDGLTTSYFIRTARTYDSLLQMGRWFGYRFGYVDLCRIYTTEDLITKFRIINQADEHLRHQFRIMDDGERTPGNFGLKIIQNDSRFRITQQNKMRTGTKQIGNPYSGALKQTYSFLISDSVIKNNFNVIDGFINELNNASTVKRENLEGKYLWRHVHYSTLLRHLPKYKLTENQQDLGTELFNYILERNQDSPRELEYWTVALINKDPKKLLKDPDGKVAGLPINFTIRNPPAEMAADGTSFIPVPVDKYSYSKNNILNGPKDEAVDLTEKELDEIYEESLADYRNGIRKGDGRKISSKANEPERDKPTGFYIRLKRPVTNGLLLLYPITWESRKKEENQLPIFGLAYSFPISNNALCEEYISNKIYQQTILSDFYE